MREIKGRKSRIMNSYARAYHDQQKTRISAGLRMQKHVEHELEAHDMMDVEYEHREDGSVKRKMVKLKKDVDKAEVEKVTKIVEDTKEFQMLASAHVRFKKLEQELLDDSEKIFSDTELWTWCKDTKGLGPVAAMVFLGYINPEIATHAGKVYAYIGATPTSKRRKGRKGNFDAEIKSKFWYVAENTIRHTDPYYYGIYQIKKAYYRARPDLTYLNSHGGGKTVKVKAIEGELEGGATVQIPDVRPGFSARKWWNSKTEVNDWNFNQSLDMLRYGYLYRSGDGGKMDGWDGWMNFMSIRFLMKILISHALETMRRELGYPTLPVDKFHKNPLPIKPKDPTNIPIILKRFEREQLALLEQNRRRWRDAIEDAQRDGSLPKELPWNFDEPPVPPKEKTKKKKDEDEENGDQ